MANKYVDISATYCGDGTTSAQAASAGAVGAWNDLVAAFKGTPAYGSLLAGDDVYVRTHDGSSALTVVLTAACTFSSIATAADPITWIFDDGTVWANGGVMELQNPSDSYYYYMTNYNNIQGNDSVKFIDTDTVGHNQDYVRLATQLINNVIFQTRPAAAAGNVISSMSMLSGSFAVLTDCTFNLYKIYTAPNRAYAPIKVPTYCYLKLVNPTIDLTGKNANSQGIFGLDQATKGLEVLGGEIVGGDEDQYVYLTYNSVVHAHHKVLFDGFDIGDCHWENEWNDRSSNDPYFSSSYDDIRFLNMPGGNFDFTQDFQNGSSHWRSSENYPVLNAMLPDDTFWSIKSFPLKATESLHVPCTQMSKLFNATAATKTITLEMLMNENFGSLDGDDFYMQVSYIDDTSGETKIETTFEDASALTTSTAAWDTTGYGSENYDKYKLELTTSFSIKQYTDVLVEVFCKFSPPSVTSFYFSCPDFAIA